MKNSTLKTCYSDDKNCLVTKLSCGHRIFVYNKMSCVWMQKYKTRYQLLVCVWFFHFFSLFSSVAPEILSVTNDNPNFWFSLKMISWQLNKHAASVSRKYKLLGLSAWKYVKHNQILKYFVFHLCRGITYQARRGHWSPSADNTASIWQEQHSLLLQLHAVVPATGKGVGLSCQLSLLSAPGAPSWWSPLWLCWTYMSSPQRVTCQLPSAVEGHWTMVQR